MMMDTKEYFLYRKCPFSYKLKYIDSVEEDKTDKQIKRDLFNKIILHLLKNLSMGFTPKIFESYLKLNSPNSSFESMRHVYLQCAHFYAGSISSLAPIEVEFHVEKKLGETCVTGSIPLINGYKGIEIVTWQFSTFSHLKIQTFAALTNVPNYRIIHINDSRSGISIKNLTSELNNNQKNIIIEDLISVDRLIKQKIFPKTSPDSYFCNKEGCSYWNKCRGNMEKFGVDTPIKKERCPQCGKDLEEEMKKFPTSLICQNCGSKPFEEPKKKEKDY